MIGELVVLLDAKQVGRVVRDTRGRLSFAHDDAWRNTAVKASASPICPKRKRNMIHGNT
jgi:hypothetical protein